MKHSFSARGVAILLTFLLASSVFSPLSAASAPALGRMATVGPTSVNGVAVPAETTLFGGELIVTEKTGWARIVLPGNEQIHIARESEVRAFGQNGGVRLELLRGAVAMHTSNASDVVVQTNCLVVAPSADGEAVWQVVHESEGVTEVTSQRGELTVRSAKDTLPVPEGRTLRIENQRDNNGAPDPRGSVVGCGTGTGIASGIYAWVVTGIVIPILFIGTNSAPVSPSGL